MTRELLVMALDALENCTSEHGHRCNRCDSEIDEGGKLVAALRAALAQPEQEPVALESVHLTRDTSGMCKVRVNGRLAIHDNGDIIDHMATLEWFAHAAIDAAMESESKGPVDP